MIFYYLILCQKNPTKSIFKILLYLLSSPFLLIGENILLHLLGVRGEVQNADIK